jgi:hypothetical protein
MEVTLEAFRASLKLTWESPSLAGEKIFSYWNNSEVTSSNCDIEQVLHIMRRADGSFVLQIANLFHEDSLERLEEILYSWALDEGWIC